MSLSPYRTPASSTTAEAPRSEPSLDVELLPVLAVVWLVSLARVVFALLGHEVFGADATLAALSVVGVPALGWNALWSLARRPRTGA